MLILLLALPCSASAEPDTAAAERFIDAFYSWDSQRLQGVLSDALPVEERLAVLYYQGWAIGGNYSVLTRQPCQPTTPITCAIKVTDDFGQAMGYTATDTFTLEIRNSLVSHVTFSGDDPPIFEELIEWIGRERPDILEGPCKDFFAGGTTPQACARAVADAAGRFVELKR